MVDARTKTEAWSLYRAENSASTVLWEDLPLSTQELYLKKALEKPCRKQCLPRQVSLSDIVSEDTGTLISMIKEWADFLGNNLYRQVAQNQINILMLALGNIPVDTRKPVEP